MRTQPVETVEWTEAQWRWIGCLLVAVIGCAILWAVKFSPQPQSGPLSTGVTTGEKDNGKQELFDALLVEVGGEYGEALRGRGLYYRTNNRLEDLTAMLLGLADSCHQNAYTKGCYFAMMGIHYDIHRYQSMIAQDYYQLAQEYCRDASCQSEKLAFHPENHLTAAADSTLGKKIKAGREQLEMAQLEGGMLLPPLVDICLVLNEHCQKASLCVDELLEKRGEDFRPAGLKKLYNVLGTKEPTEAIAQESTPKSSSLQIAQQKPTSTAPSSPGPRKPLPTTKQAKTDEPSETFSDFEEAYFAKAPSASMTAQKKSSERLKRDIKRFEEEISQRKQQYIREQTAMERLFRLAANDHKLQATHYRIQSSRFPAPHFIGFSVELELFPSAQLTDEQLWRKALACLHEAMERYERRKSRRLRDHQTEVNLHLPSRMWDGRAQWVNGISLVGPSHIRLINTIQAKSIVVEIRCKDYYQQALKEHKLNLAKLQREIRIRQSKLSQLN
ncbi:MAG: hypothetical protein AAFV95_24095 [Bacteroidota bacterium]